MSDVTVSRQKAEYVSHNAELTRGKSKYVELVYKRLDGDNPGTVQKTGAFVATLDRESIDRIKAGGTFVVVKTKEGDYWNLTKVDDVSTYVARAPSTFRGGSNKGSSGSSYDTTGVKVGAARNQAIAFLAATKGTKFTLDDVDTVAYDIVKRQAAQEDMVRAGSNTTTNMSQTKVAPKVTEETFEEESLDSIDF